MMNILRDTKYQLSTQENKNNKLFKVVLYGLERAIAGEFSVEQNSLIFPALRRKACVRSGNNNLVHVSTGMNVQDKQSSASMLKGNADVFLENEINQLTFDSVKNLKICKNRSTGAPYSFGRWSVSHIPGIGGRKVAPSSTLTIRIALYHSRECTGCFYAPACLLDAQATLHKCLEAATVGFTQTIYPVTAPSSLCAALPFIPGDPDKNKRSSLDSILDIVLLEN
ncbi:hypothetical protein GQX74_014520 [Glossina fuscipes]|nr:hypothetical protein GQX74_014520 [Glossina fuscipes]